MTDFSFGFTEGSFLLLNGQKHLRSVAEDLISTVNDRLSAAALDKVLRFLGAALIQLRCLIDCGAYFKDC